VGHLPRGSAVTGPGHDCDRRTATAGHVSASQLRATSATSASHRRSCGCARGRGLGQRLRTCGERRALTDPSPRGAVLLLLAPDASATPLRKAPARSEPASPRDRRGPCGGGQRVTGVLAADVCVCTKSALGHQVSHTGLPSDAPCLVAGPEILETQRLDALSSRLCRASCPASPRRIGPTMAAGGSRMAGVSPPRCSVHMQRRRSSGPAAPGRPLRHDGLRPIRPSSPSPSRSLYAAGSPRTRRARPAPPSTRPGCRGPAPPGPDREGYR
jgi:hypothetical protein